MTGAFKSKQILLNEGWIDLGDLFYRMSFAMISEQLDLLPIEPHGSFSNTFRLPVNQESLQPGQ
jgi:hypothetical protein